MRLQCDLKSACFLGVTVQDQHSLTEEIDPDRPEEESAIVTDQVIAKGFSKHQYNRGLLK